MEESTRGNATQPLNENIQSSQNITHNRRNSSNGKTIGVIGTGNAAIAITKRLLVSGYSVVVGSRKPNARHATLTQLGHCLCGAELTTIAECLRRCDVIIIAIHMENFKITFERFTKLTRGKILVDISNRERRYALRSNAEYLASILPEAAVVKAFNTISASIMENKFRMSVESHKVYVACDDENVRNKILDLARSLGFHGVDYGALRNSLSLEDFVLKTFTHWKIPIFLTIGIFNLWSLYIVYIYFIEKTSYRWEQIFLKVLNKPVCMTAITTLALTYLPGQVAAIIQVCRGTKHSRFPQVLDTWLKFRKQFGLITFALACFHTIASTLMLSPTYYSSWFHQPTVQLPVHPQNFTALTLVDPKVILVSPSWMIWKGELALFFGILAFLSMSLQAVTSIESVANSLNWSEWRCVQSHMGTGVLILAACHVFSMGIPGWIKDGPMKSLGSITFLSLILPLVVLLLKFIFRWTPLYCYLGRIRKGWERKREEKYTDSQTTTLDSIRLGKQNYEPLLQCEKRGKSCCSNGEEDPVRLVIEGEDGGHLDRSDIRRTCCDCKNGRVQQSHKDDGNGNCCKSKKFVQFSTSANNSQCDCSVV